MDHNQLKCFISVARTLNFSEAARRNYVSQSSVSRYIKDLEKEFGVKLFKRSKREVSLTDEGKLFLPYAQEIIETLNKATTAISQLNNGRGGKITIAYDEATGDYPAKCLENFTRKYPDVFVNMVKVPSGESSSALADRDCDFFFMLRDMLPESGDIESAVTNKDTLSLVVSTKDGLSKRGYASNTDLKSKRFILLSESENPILYMEIMNMFRTLHITAKSIITFDDVRSVLMAVSAGIGVSLLPSQLALNYSVPSVRVLSLKDVDLSLSYAVAWHKNISNPAARLFLEVIYENIEDGEDEQYII